MLSSAVIPRRSRIATRADLFIVPGAAELLLPLACAREPSEARERAAAALRALDPDAPLPWTRGRLAPAVQAIAETLFTALYSIERVRREQAAELLLEVCRQAAQ